MKRWIAGMILLCSMILLSVSGYFLTDMLMQERKDDGVQEQLKKIYEDSENMGLEEMPEEKDGGGDADNGAASFSVHPGFLLQYKNLTIVSAYGCLDCYNRFHFPGVPIMPLLPEQ